MKDPIELPDLEALSRGMTYSIPDCDHSGWPLGHRFRLPTTFNYKYRNPNVINVLSVTGRTYGRDTVADYLARTGQSATGPVQPDLDLDWEPQPLDVGIEELFEKHRRAIKEAAKHFRTPAQDRSAALWAFTNACFRAGLNRDEVYALAKRSVNNKFADSKYRGDEDLKKDVLRAERQYTKAVKNIKDLIQQILMAPGVAAHKRILISNVVREDMDKMGDFVVTQGEQPWYLRKDTGRPILMGKHSVMLEALMETRYGLNAVDSTYAYVVNHLLAFTTERGRAARQSALSYYDGSSVLLHGGRQHTWLVTKDSVTQAPDGQYGVLFPWTTSDPFEPGDPLDVDDWCAWMLEGFFTNLTELTPAEATALIRVWVMFILFRDDAVARPILALFGMQGSGKTTIFHLIYALLYGPNKGLNSITSPENFDAVTASEPFVVFDNVDTWAPWLPDKFALASANSDIVKRRLYTDSDTVTQQRQALIGVSAHSPRFGREDVVDRMLIINFERLKEFTSEKRIIDRVVLNRRRLWGSIIKDIQAVLAEPQPREEDLPQLRVLDFSRVGLRIARAVGVEEAFLSAITKARKSQVRFTLSEEDNLVDVIQKWHGVATRPRDEYLPAGRLWELLCVMDDNFARAYRNPAGFSRKLWTMAEVLKTVFSVEYKLDTDRGVRMWKIEPRMEALNG